MTRSRPAAPAPPPAPSLRRALGRWDLTAIGVNQVIGGAIFLMPSQVMALLGMWSPIAFVLAGAASLAVALSFAEVGSRFDSTGGPYLYSRAAFGRFVAFEIGWMQWFTRAASAASVVNGIALAIGFYWPAMGTGIRRGSTVTVVAALLTLANLRGIRLSAGVVNALTLGKLMPLAVFIAAGLAAFDASRFTVLPPLSLQQASAGALLLVFVFGGFDIIGVPAGEARDPRSHVPFALVATIAVVTAVFTLAQVVAMSTLPDLASSRTPLADAASRLMGAPGALLIGVGSLAAMSGNIAGGILSGSRILFALAEHGHLPAWFATISPRFRTPFNAVLFTGAISLVLAVSGTFATLAMASAVARLVTYTGTCAATLALRRPVFASTVAPPTFVIPLGPVVPIAAVFISIVILAGASREQLAAGGLALAAGALLLGISEASRRRVPSPPKRGRGLG